ncbi:hypothetical protein [Devosia chinhatensis]|nr:hypothetical protein [Devosia chinhatensis]
MTGEYLPVLIDNGDDRDRYAQRNAHVLGQVVKLLTPRPVKQA